MNKEEQLLYWAEIVDNMIMGIYEHEKQEEYLIALQEFLLDEAEQVNK